MSRPRGRPPKPLSELKAQPQPGKWAGYDAARGRPRVGVVLEREVIDDGKAIAEEEGTSFSAWLNDLARTAIEQKRRRPKKST